jgi:3-phenylpropionate/trans-cinnamate dioxygenase ferredoxin reductase subunit
VASSSTPARARRPGHRRRRRLHRAAQADGSLLRLESVNNATEQGKSAAAALLGQPRPFTGTPWFWSDQYDRKLQMAGLSTGSDDWVLRGSLQAPGFSVWHFKGGRLIAVDTVNAAKDHLLARKLLDAGRSPTPAQVADTGFDPGHGAGRLTRPAPGAALPGARALG